VRFTQTTATFFVFVHFPHTEFLSAAMSQVAWRSVFGTTTSERLIWNVSLVPTVTIISNGCLYYSTGVDKRSAGVMKTQEHRQP
jgi:hypothetical protein